MENKNKSLHNPVEEFTPSFECENCHKCFSHKTSLWKHKKYNCEHGRTENCIELMRLIKNQYLKNISFPENSVYFDSKSINHLSKKISTSLMINHECNKDIADSITHVSDTVSGISTRMEIFSYKETDLSNMTDDEMSYIYSKYTNSIPHCLKLLHCNEAYPEHMNMYITNLKGTHIVVYDNKKWK